MGRALSEDEISTLRGELNAGNTPTVWFTASAVGVKEGRSGKVTHLDEPAEGDFIQVRPASSKDVLSFSASEVTRERPARTRAAKGQRSGAADSDKTSAGKTSAGKTSAGKTDAGAATSRSEDSGAAKTASAGARGSTRGSTRGSESGQSTISKSDASQSGTSKSARSSQQATSDGSGAGRSTSQAAASATSGTKRASGSGKTEATTAGPGSASGSAAGTNRNTSAGRTGGQRGSRGSAGAVVTLSADAEGQWNVEVTTGRKRVVRATPVAPAAVAQAAQALHDDVAAAVQPVLDATRERQRARVEQLRQELADAQQMLADLDAE